MSPARKPASSNPDPSVPLSHALGNKDNPSHAQHTVAMMLASPAFMAQELLTGPEQAPYNGRFMVAQHHMAWDRLVTEHSRICVLASRDSGKCAARNSTILRVDGQRIPIQRWRGGHVLALDPETSRMGPAYAPASQPNGMKPCLRIITEGGRSETVTLNHPLRTRNAWVEVKDLEVGDKIATYVNGRVCWERIEIIRDAGVQDTFGLCVPGPQNYVGQDIINHNTFFFNFAVIIWKIISQPNARGFIFSATQTQVERIMEDIRSEIENNPKLRWLYPTGPLRRWSSSYIKTSNGHRIYARGYGTKVRGGHPDYIVVDDGLNDETAYSVSVRTKQIDYFYTAITNMVVPGGQIIVVGTPFARDDLYANLSKNKSYKYQVFSARNSLGQPLWPARYSVKALKAKEEEIGPIRFAREFMCVPVADEMSLFPSKLFVGDPVEQMTVKLGQPLSYWAEYNLDVYVAVDIAMSSNVGADYFVIYTVGKDRNGVRWLMDLQRHRGLPFQEQLSKINAIGRKYQPSLVLIESNQAQRVFGDELIRTTDLPIKKYNTTSEKHSLETGVPRLRMLYENQKYRLPRGDAHSVEMTDILIDEMHNITFNGGKMHSVGSHDDALMASYLAEVAIAMGGFSFSFGEGEDGAAPEGDGTDASPDALEYDEFGNPV